MKKNKRKNVEMKVVNTFDLKGMLITKTFSKIKSNAFVKPAVRIISNIDLRIDQFNKTRDF